MRIIKKFYLNEVNNIDSQSFGQFKMILKNNMKEYIMRESIKMKTNDYNFKFRVSGLIIKNNKLLLVDMDDSGFLCLPGGYVELGETTEEAVKRELNEEIRQDVRIEKYLGVVENYFINKYNKKMHEISFYYLMNFVNNDIGYDEFTLIENDKGHKIKLDFKWVDINDLDNFDVRPAFLKRIINNKLEFNHLIFDELEK